MRRIVKTLKLLVDHDSFTEAMDFMHNETQTEDFSEPLNWEIYNVDSNVYKTKRAARKMVNDYAVTAFPFVLILDEDDEAYAAIYSEDAPITIERINEKL